MSRLLRPALAERLHWAIIAVSLWTIAPICVVYGGWTGLIGTVAAWGAGSHLLRKRQQWLAARTPVSASGLP